MSVDICACPLVRMYIFICTCMQPLCCYSLCAHADIEWKYYMVQKQVRVLFLSNKNNHVLLLVSVYLYLYVKHFQTVANVSISYGWALMWCLVMYMINNIYFFWKIKLTYNIVKLPYEGWVCFWINPHIFFLPFPHSQNNIWRSVRFVLHTKFLLAKPSSFWLDWHKLCLFMCIRIGYHLKNMTLKLPDSSQLF